MGRASRKGRSSGALREAPEQLSDFPLHRAIEELQVPPTRAAAVGEALLRIRDLSSQMDMEREGVPWDNILQRAGAPLELYDGQDLPAAVASFELSDVDTAEQLDLVRSVLQGAWDSFSLEEQQAAQEHIGELEHLRAVIEGRDMFRQYLRDLLDAKERFASQAQDESLTDSERHNAKVYKEQAERARRSAHENTFVSESTSVARRSPSLLGESFDVGDYIGYGIHKELLGMWPGDEEFSTKDAERVMRTFDRIEQMDELPQVWDEDVYRDLLVAEKILRRMAPGGRGSTIIAEGLDDQSSPDDEDHCLALATGIALLRGDSLASVWKRSAAFA